MQTFLPYPSFEASAEVLDYKRCGKQRVEAYQILKALADPKYGWQNAPATNLWRGYEKALISYYAAICREWISRGYKHTMPILIPEDLTPEDMPEVFGDFDFHFSHKSNLYQKNPEYYSLWEGIPAVNYVWKVDG